MAWTSATSGQAATRSAGNPRRALSTPPTSSERTWLRSFHGGLLTTCGLQNVGLPSEDEGTSHGLHGRISNIPARNVVHRVVELDGQLVAEVSGEVRETDVFGSDLLLRRRILLPMGETVAHVDDEVVNQGFAPTAAAHPLSRQPRATRSWPTRRGWSGRPPRSWAGTRRAQAVVADHATFTAPQDGAREHVFEHRLREPGAARASISVANPVYAPTGGIAVTVTWDPRQLPRLWQWRMLRAGMYVTGLEPANCGLAGRAAERAAGTLQVLEPGEARRFGISVRVSIGDEVAALVAG